MRRFLLERKEDMFLRGQYDTFVANTRALMGEAVRDAVGSITQHLARRIDRHCLRACIAAERG